MCTNGEITLLIIEVNIFMAKLLVKYAEDLLLAEVMKRRLDKAIE